MIESNQPLVALVTGGAVRVGRAIVRELAACGYRVAIHGNTSLDRAQELVGIHAGDVLELARLLVAAPDRRLSDDGLDTALRAIGIEPPAGSNPVGGVRRARRRRRA